MNQNEQSLEVKSRNLGLILAGITGGAGLLLSVLCAPFVSPALRRICLPYVPATKAQIENVLRALKGRSGAVVDLGSGDGRIVLSVAQAGFPRVVGVELNPWLVTYAKIQGLRHGFSPEVSFYRKDLWKFNLNRYSNIIIFGVEEMMVELESKFCSELEQGACIIACRFPLPSFEPAATFGHGVDAVWLYDIPFTPRKSAHSE